MEIKAIIFDMDGLMFDSERLLFENQHQVAREIGIPFSLADYKQTIGFSDAKVYRKFQEDFGSENVAHQLVFETRRRLEEQIAADGFPLKKGLKELLAFLQQQGIRMAVASSSTRKDVQQYIGKAGLSTCFSGIVGGDEVKEAKPHPEIFLKARQLLEVDRENCLILEDSLNGIRAAHAAGIRVIMVPDLLEPNEEAISKSLTVLPDLLAVKDWLVEQNQ